MPEGFYSVKKENSDGSLVSCDRECYPYGTQLRMDKEMIEDMGVDALSVGDVVEVRGFAFVESKHVHESKDDSDKGMSLQLTEIKVRRETDDRAKQLYGGE